MENIENHKSFEQIVKESQSKNRMQELAGIQPSQPKRTFSQVADDLLKVLDQVDIILSSELKKP
jgi:hypothetical protein